METRTDQVRRDIDQIRGDLGQTLEALGDRVAPAKVAARTKEQVADKVEDVREHLSPSRAVKRQTHKLGDGLRNLMGADTEDRVPAVAGKANEVAARAAGAASAAAGAAQGAPAAVGQRARSNPLAFGLLTFAGGFLVASVLPPTERERQASQRIKAGLQPAIDEAVERGRSVAGELGQSVQESLEEVKRAASDAAERVAADAAESADELKAQARSAASEVKDEVQETAGQLKSRAQEATAQVLDETSDAVSPSPSAGGVRASSRPRPLRAPSRGVRVPATGTR